MPLIEETYYYPCGFSMGGEGTFKIIQEYPDYFAAALPMGMNFTGDSTKVKNIPIWTNQGETDWFARLLRKQVAAIRALNGYLADTGSTWVTGVNPRYSKFNGVGHGVQWNAASTQDLTGWAYSKVNDGNKYPYVFFISPRYGQAVEAGKPLTIEINARDPDGSIASVEVYQNKLLKATLKKEPFTINLTPVKGDNLIEAIAYDEKGKSSVATNIIKVNVRPVFTSGKIPVTKVGAWFEHQLTALGNGRKLFTLIPGTKLPQGLVLYPNGVLKGVPQEKGDFNIDIQIKDEDNEGITKSFYLSVTAKAKGEILVKNAITKDGTHYRISKLINVECPFFNSKDSLLTTDLEEINFSNPGKYEGLTFIQTDINDANKTGDDFLGFDIDENAVIYVAYEKLDSLMHSAIPDWLKTFRKEPGEIAAQYRYFDVYSKTFSKGTIRMPAADARINKVASNYFVLIKK